MRGDNTLMDDAKYVKKVLVTNIKRYRKKTGLSQREAAQATGISLKYWQRLEMTSQDDFPSFPMLSEIAKVLKTKMSFLLKEK